MRSSFSGNTSVGGTGTISVSRNSLNLTNVTVTNNNGGGIDNDSGAITATNSIIAHQASGNDCVGAMIDGGNNLESATSCGFTAAGSLQNVTITQLALGALADNGGLTQTHALSVGSVAIDAGNNATCLLTDQRGVIRPQGAVCDIGAYEYVDTISPLVTSITRANPSPTNLASVDFTVTFSESVAGVDTADFDLTTSGVSSAAVSGVSGTGSVYTVTVNTGFGNGTIRLNVISNGTILDVSLNSLGANFTSGEVYSVIKLATFADVPLSHWANSYIERLYFAGFTRGCASSPLIYCPNSPVTRAQLAVLLLRGIHGAAYTPPAVGASTGFNDVPTTHWAAAWIKQLAAEGITSGCGGGNFCPEASASRAQIAILLVRATHGVSFVPPTATGIFADVPPGSFGADYIEQLVADGITTGCGAGNYCPGNIANRDQIAVFLVRAFNLP
ncbi:MAG: S-layer homology domain-containing protein [Chloroflexi bacterium]|nr:S-layer homology domain-containing protein [Chloroflexota bacterium]